MTACKCWPLQKQLWIELFCGDNLREVGCILLLGPLVASTKFLSKTRWENRKWVVFRLPLMQIEPFCPGLTTLYSNITIIMWLRFI